MTSPSQLARRISPYLGAFLVLVVLRTTGVAQTIDLVLYDLVIHRRPAASGLNTDITLIGIEESDLRRFHWPVDDALLCRAIDTLHGNGAIAIGFDLYRDVGVGPQQQCLRDRFRQNPTLISISNVAAGIGPVPGTPAERQSYNDMTVDADGVLRRDLVHVTGQDESMVSFPMRVMEVATGDNSLRRSIEAGTHHGAWVSANSGGYHNEAEADLGFQSLLLFREPGSYRQYNLGQLLDDEIPEKSIRDRIVLIGSTAPSLRDLFEVPHSRFRQGSELFQLAGLEIHANRIAALLDQRSQTVPVGWIMPGWGNLLLVLISGIGGVLLGERIQKLQRSEMLTAAAAAGLGGGLLLLLSQLHVWIGVVMPVSALLGMSGAAWVRRGAISQQHSQQIRRLLGQTTSPAVAQQLWNQREDLLRDGRFKGQQLPVTVLFTDTANFTSVSEQLEPGELMDWLNRGMAVCIPAVTRRGGMVNKFTGDGMLAVFGVPIRSDPAAEAAAAIEAAIEINTGLRQLNEEFLREQAPQMRMRAGISSGVALVGSMGSSERIEYAVIGDSVNCASRLESLEKTRHQGALRVLVSDSTLNLLDAEFRDRLPLNHWGPVQVRGREAAISVHEIRMDTAPADGTASQD